MPLTALFGLISGARRTLYSKGFLKSSAPNVPVIIVGGITVGGSGKTPLCIALLNLLKEQGWHPGLLSRGYKGHSDSYPLKVTLDTAVQDCGDEPYLIKSSVKDDAIVVVDPVRTRGAFYLASCGCDIILCDDGMQHYALARDAEIAVLDGVRRLGNSRLLPSGPLREGAWRLKKVDLKVLNGGICIDDEYAMHLIPSYPQALDERLSTKLPAGSEVCALAGIGNPKRFYNTLSQSTFENTHFIIKEHLSVQDHHKVSLDTLREMTMRYPVVMTAKDAVKYRNCGIKNLYVLNVKAELTEDFKKAFFTLVKKANTRCMHRKNIYSQYQ